MRTTRRQFLTSLIATAATAAIAPQVLVESVHGASDLSAHERDVAADVMGLRSKQWRGLIVGRANEALRRLGKAAQDTGHSFDALRYITYPVLDGRDSSGRLQFRQVVLPKDMPEPEVKVILEAAARRVAKPFGATWVDESEERDQQILLGRPGGQMPVGVLSADEIEEAWRQAGEERPAKISRTECVKAYLAARAGWGDNMYDSEPRALLHYGVSPLEPAFREYLKDQAIERLAKDRS